MCIFHHLYFLPKVNKQTMQTSGMEQWSGAQALHLNTAGFKYQLCSYCWCDLGQVILPNF